MNITYFKDKFEFRKWLQNNYESEKEIIVGLYKVKSGKMNMSWSEFVDQALCFVLDGLMVFEDLLIKIATVFDLRPGSPNVTGVMLTLKKWNN
jgi:uncharacterized protein YdeI (YjbR/CyaY-like superfamily)